MVKELSPEDKRHHWKQAETLGAILFACWGLQEKRKIASILETLFGSN